MFIDFRERGREGGERERDRGREGEGERGRDINLREKHQLVASPMCPDQELDLQPR